VTEGAAPEREGNRDRERPRARGDRARPRPGPRLNARTSPRPPGCVRLAAPCAA